MHSCLFVVKNKPFYQKIPTNTVNLHTEKQPVSYTILHLLNIIYPNNHYGTRI